MSVVHARYWTHRGRRSCSEPTNRRSSRRLFAVLVAVAVALALGSGVATATTASATPTANRLFWIADPGAGNQLWSATSNTVPTATAQTSGSPVTGAYRSLATDGTSLYFCDGTNLVRTALDGTGKTIVVAGVATAEQIVIAGGNLYYTLYSSGVYVVSASATNGTPSLILTNNEWGWDGIAISGSTLYAENYNDGLYTATLNGTSPATVADTNTHVPGITKLLVDGNTLYAGGINGQILHTTDPNAVVGLWGVLSLFGVTGGAAFSMAIVGTTLYYTSGPTIGSIQTDGTGNIMLSNNGEFQAVWSIVGLEGPPVTIPNPPSWVQVAVGSGAALVRVFPGAPNGVVTTSYTVTLPGTTLHCTVPSGHATCVIAGLPYRSKYSFSVVANGGTGHSAVTVGIATMVLRTVKTAAYFGAVSSTLTSAMKARLAAFVKSLPQGATVIGVDVIGYVQASVDKSNDASLSLARARAVAAYLTARGVHARITVHGRGILGVTRWSRAATVTLTYAVQKANPLPT